MVKAPIGKRIVAYIIDCVLMSVVVFVLLIGAMIVSFVLAWVSDSLGALSMLLWLAAVGVAFIVMLGYALLRDGLNGGRSYGKKFMGLKVLKDGKPCGYKDSALRNVILCILGPIDLIFVFIDADGKRLGDKVAGTQVVAA